ncbi:MAG: hypothetical protein ACLQGP_08850 [Isosphaeraceae bacterium]
MSFLNFARPRHADPSPADPERSRIPTGDRKPRHKGFNSKPCLEIVEDRTLLSTIVDLGTLGGSSSEAQGINASGQVVGESATASGGEDAFLYSDGEMMDLGAPAGGVSAAEAINDAGEIVGNAGSPGNPAYGIPDTYYPFLYADGDVQYLGTLGAAYNGLITTSAQAINDAGQVAGYAETASGAVHAFLYANDAMNDLGTLASPSTYYTSEANGINAKGDVVGFSDTNTSIDAFLYTNGNMEDLGTGPGSESVANGINASGEVVGYYEVFHGRFPTLYASSVGAHTLNLLYSNVVITVYEPHASDP